VVLRRTRAADLAALAAIINEPEVVRWWGPHDEERLRDELLDDPQVESFTVELDGDLIGLVEVCEEHEPDYRHAGLDITIRSDLHDERLGRESLRVVIDHLVRERGHHRFTIDPAVGNERAIRCYAAVGFKPVGVMRRSERAPDGTWRDGLLMDLLADELPD
jgi:aminoglycoside 6'-N-acetyltransferase